LIVKWLALLHIAVPKVRDVAILFNPDNVLDPYWSAQFEEAAQVLKGESRQTCPWMHV
jgi:hypothetical protein